MMSKGRFLNKTQPPTIITLVLIASISVLSMNMLLPSLPTLTDYFQTSYSIMQFTVTGYLAASGALQLVFGPLSDRFGRRPVILTGLVIFLIGSVICLFSSHLEFFLLGRVLQTSAACGMVLSRAIVRDRYGTDEAASMLGYVTVGMMVVPMFSPLVGGLLDQSFGWQSVFIFMIGFGLVVFTLCYFDLGETNDNKSTSLLQQVRDYPELMRSRRFWGYTMSAAFASGAYFSLLGGAPFVATEHLGLSPSEFGALFLFIATGYLIGNFLSGRYSKRVGINKMMLYGGLIALCGLSISLTLNLMSYVTILSFFGPIFFVGLGNGLTMPNANAGIVSIRPKLAGSASGLGGAAMIGVGSILAAFAASILTKQSGPLPLLLCMFGTSVFAFLTTLYVIHIERHSSHKISEADLRE